jgi:hypothetical protein
MSWVIVHNHSIKAGLLMVTEAESKSRSEGRHQRPMEFGLYLVHLSATYTLVSDLKHRPKCDPLGKYLDAVSTISMSSGNLRTYS